MWTRRWALDALERCLATFAGAVLAFAGGDTLNLTEVYWPAALSIAGGAALVSLLKAIVAAGVGEVGTAALLPAPGGRHAKKEN